MSSIKDVPENVKTHLLPDERVIGRFSSIFREYYATDKRLIGFQRPDWVVGGIVATVATYKAASEGGVYFIFWGAVIFGAIDFFRGLAGWLKYNN